MNNMGTVRALPSGHEELGEKEEKDVTKKAGGTAGKREPGS